jgi:ABC-type sugar transport system ATPase subunit
VFYIAVFLFLHERVESLSEFALKMEGIYKEFPGVVAVNMVDLEVRHGEVLALIGENGAGKSTMIKILSGAYSCDKGTIYVDGKEMGRYTPKQAIDSGISVIYQELNYLNYMSVAENIFIGNIPLKKKSRLVDYAELKRRSIEVQKMVGLEHIDPMTTMGQLSVSEKQLVEIGRAYARNVKILVMDEPTSALNDRECEKLFQLIDMLKKQGKAIIYISHKLDEVVRVSDRIQVMRDGRSVGVKNANDITKNEMVNMMVGRTITEMYPISKREIGEPLLEVRGMTNHFLKDVSFTLHKGEILGLFGLMGAGCDEIVRTLFGLMPLSSGEIFVDGKKVAIKSSKDAIKNGMAYVPSERKTEGLILMQSVKANIVLLQIDKLMKNFTVDKNRETELALEWSKKLNVKAPGIDTITESLSGGNQQKVVLAKWMLNKPKILILNEPTKGIDVGAKVEIYKLIEDFCKQGLGVIMVSSEMAEVMFTSDRVHVVYNGEIRAEFTKEEVTQEKILQRAMGE